MKTALTLAFLLITSLTMANHIDQRASLKSVPAKQQNLFQFKVSKKFKKAMVDVYSSDGELVATTALAKRKMVINFQEVQSGIYIIKVRKHNCVEEYQFEKK